MRVTRKVFTRAAANLFFNQFSGDILSSFSVSFAFFNSCFVCLFVCLLFFEIKNVCFDCLSSGDMYLFSGTSNSSLVLSFSKFLEYAQDVFKTLVILSAILLPIKSPVACAVF